MLTLIQGVMITVAKVSSTLWTCVLLATALYIVVEWLVTDEYQEISDYCDRAIGAYGPLATSQVDCP